MPRSLALFSVIALLLGPAFAAAQPSPGAEIAPAGKLRAAVIGIRVLGGVGEPIGTFIAERLGAAFAPVVYSNPQAYEQG